MADGSNFDFGNMEDGGGYPDLSGLAHGASPYPVGTPASPSFSSGSQYSQNGPTLPPPELGQPNTQMYGRLQSVLGDPSQIANDPAYKFLMDQGMQGLNRSMAAKKMAVSGNAGLGAINYGQGLAANYFNQMVPQLLAGSKQELDRYEVPAKLGVARYAASHGGTSYGNQSSQGSNAGTQGDMGARDLLRQLAGQGGGGAGRGNYGGVPSTSPAPYPQQGRGYGGNQGGPMGPNDYAGPSGYDPFNENDPFNQAYNESDLGYDDLFGGEDFGGGGGGGVGQDWQGSSGQMPQGGGGNQDPMLMPGLDYPMYDYSGGSGIYDDWGGGGGGW